MNSSDRLPEDSHNHRISDIDSRKFHIVGQRIGRDTLQHELASVSVFSFIALERDPQQSESNQDDEGDYEQRQNQCKAADFSLAGEIVLHTELLTVTAAGSDLPQDCVIINIVSIFVLCRTSRLSSWRYEGPLTGQARFNPSLPRIMCRV